MQKNPFRVVLGETLDMATLRLFLLIAAVSAVVATLTWIAIR